MNIEEEIIAIKERNARVEAEKAWEISNARKITLLMITYFLACLLMAAIGVERPYINALIPAMGFFLSTLSVGFIKSYWLRNIYNHSNGKE